MLVVIALGGNALLQRGQALEAEIQQENVKVAAQSIAAFIKQGHQVVLCHGNGPQVGLLALQSAAYQEVQPYPFDVLNAESQSMIGYMLQQALQNELSSDKMVTLVTQVEVDSSDASFASPTKFIGPQYQQSLADQYQRECGWQMANDQGKLRRVVASPSPIKIIELTAIQKLIQSNFNVICAGGGGIPVICHLGKLQGVEAVIDKDRTAALLAQKIDAQHLVILTDVAGVYEHWNTPKQSCIRKINSDKLAKMSFPAGSMGPKVQAACQFANQTKRSAYIGSLSKLDEIINNQCGTEVIAAGEDQR